MGRSVAEKKMRKEVFLGAVGLLLRCVEASDRNAQRQTDRQRSRETDRSRRRRRRKEDQLRI